MKKTSHKIIWFLLLVIVMGGGAATYWWIHEQPIPVANQYTIRLNDETGKAVDFQYGSIPSLTNPDYYKNVRTQLIASKANFIDADLSAMKLVVYKQGASVLQVDIKAKGAVGTWSQTPSGLYKADAKEKIHYSSFEPVSMKWDIPFQGNYFIHGWPVLNKTGKPVDSTDSAGCIRLSDVDAKSVYDLADVGMPILVHEEAPVDGFNYTVGIPAITAKSYLAADLTNNFVFLEHNQAFSYPMADFTKIVNAFVVSEYMNFDTPIAVTKDTLASTTKPRLVTGQKYRPYDLMFPMIVERSNEAALTLAKPLGKQNFIDLMNKKVQSLGMMNTIVVDPSGESNSNVTTAGDLFALAKAINQYRAFILTMSKKPSDAMMYGPSKFTDLVVNNELTDDIGYIGGMVTRGEQVNGENTQSILAVYKISFKGQQRTVAFISFDSTGPVNDVHAMLQYAMQVYGK